MIGTPPRNIWSPPWTSTKFPKRRRTICLLSWSVRRKILSRSDSADSDQPVRHDQFIATSRAASYNRAAQPFSLRSRRQRKAWGVSPGTSQRKIFRAREAGDSGNATVRVVYFTVSPIRKGQLCRPPSRADDYYWFKPGVPLLHPRLYAIACSAG